MDVQALSGGLDVELHAVHRVPSLIRVIRDIRCQDSSPFRAIEVQDEIADTIDRFTSRDAFQLEVGTEGTNDDRLSVGGFRVIQRIIAAKEEDALVLIGKVHGAIGAGEGERSHRLRW